MVALLIAGIIVLPTEPPKERPLPTVESVRDALRRNADRIAKRRAKIVMVISLDDAADVTPSIGHPDRIEFDQVCAEGRWRERSSTFRAGKLVGISERSLIGSVLTSLQTDLSGEQTSHRATRKSIWDGSVLRPASFFSERLGHAIRGRPTLRWADDGQPLLVLGLFEGAGTSRLNFLLDPARSHWPVGSYSENQMKDGIWETSSSTQVVEFDSVRGTWYPKRSATTRKRAGSESKEIETVHLIVAAVEFPDRFGDDDFRVEFPDGAEVDDAVSGKRYVKGIPETGMPKTVATSPPIEVAEVKRGPPLDLQIIYFCFLLGVTGVAAAARYLVMNGSLRWPWQ